jgi:hypothetical protein
MSAITEAGGNITPYLERAMTAIRGLGVNVAAPQQSPVLAILERIKDYDEGKVLSIAATLQQSSTFNDIVRTQLSGMEISARYADIASGFDSIRDDAKAMAGWMEDGKLDFREKVQLHWMNLRRGSVPDRFEKIKALYLEVAKSALGQIDREATILEAYKDFRMALKASEIEAQELLQVASKQLASRKDALAVASRDVESFAGSSNADRSRLELVRDEALRALQDEDRRYQVAKDLGDDMKTAYSSAELVFARLEQTTAVKQRLYDRAVTFFSTNEVVFTGLQAAFTSMAGLGEATNTLDSMKSGMSQSIEDLATIGGKQLDRGLRAGYGATLQVGSVKALADAVVEFQASSQKLIQELRDESSLAASEIEAAVEDGKRRFAALAVKG